MSQLKLLPDWTEVKDDSVQIPDEFADIFNRIGFQMRFVTVSGKNEILAVVHILRKAEVFFHEYYSKQIKTPNFAQFMEDHTYWADKTFNIKSPLAPLNHLKLEVEEAIQEPDNITEYADCFALLIYALSKAGFTLSDLYDELYRKLEVNKDRTWHKVGEGENAHYQHIPSGQEAVNHE